MASWCSMNGRPASRFLRLHSTLANSMPSRSIRAGRRDRRAHRPAVPNRRSGSSRAGRAAGRCSRHGRGRTAGRWCGRASGRPGRQCGWSAGSGGGRAAARSHIVIGEAEGRRFRRTAEPWQSGGRGNDGGFHNEIIPRPGALQPQACGRWGKGKPTARECWRPCVSPSASSRRGARCRPLFPDSGAVPGHCSVYLLDVSRFSLRVTECATADGHRRPQPYQGRLRAGLRHAPELSAVSNRRAHSEPARPSRDPRGPPPCVA